MILFFFKFECLLLKYRNRKKSIFEVHKIEIKSRFHIELIEDALKFE